VEKSSASRRASGDNTAAAAVFAPTDDEGAAPTTPPPAEGGGTAATAEDEDPMEGPLGSFGDAVIEDYIIVFEAAAARGREAVRRAERGAASFFFAKSPLLDTCITLFFMSPLICAPTPNLVPCYLEKLLFNNNNIILIYIYTVKV